MTIKIDLSNRPKTAQRSPGFDFPRKCFDMSIRIQCAFEALTGAEPWGNTDPEVRTRALALRTLHKLEAEAKTLLNPSTSPEYDLALKALLGEEDHKAAIEGSRKDELWPEYVTWLEKEVLPKQIAKVYIAKLDMTKLRADVCEFTQKIESVGLYFWRMMQAVNAEHLPNEIEITVGPSEDPTQKSWMMSGNLPNLTR